MTIMSAFLVALECLQNGGLSGSHIADSKKNKTFVFVIKISGFNPCNDSNILITYHNYTKPEFSIFSWRNGYKTSSEK